MAETVTPEKPRWERSRRLKLVTLSLDKHSLELLRELAPTKKSLGLTIGALVQAEYARRLERAAARGQGNGGCPLPADS